jgi:hypothetical protein
MDTLGYNSMPWYGSHSYLNDYIIENGCTKLMEIGVYNGENAKSMVETAIKKVSPQKVEYHGFDYFYIYSRDQIEKKLEKIGCKYFLYKGNTLETIPKTIKFLKNMDLIFIDAGKSFKESWSDWNNSSKLMHEMTGVFVHNVGFRGVGKMVDKIPRDKYQVEIFHAHSEGSVALLKRKE